MSTRILTTGLFVSTLALAASAHLGQLTMPKAGDTYAAGSTVAVKWTVPTPHTTQDLAYSQDGKTWTTITTGLARTVSSYTWTVPDKPSTTTRFRVCQRDGANVQGCTDTHNTQSLGSAIPVTGGGVYTAITGNFTVTGGGTPVKPLAGSHVGARIQYDASARAIGLSFDMESRARVVLQAYDLKGNLLATLLDMEKAAGRHVLSVFSNALPTGKVAVLRLQTGGHATEQLVGAGR